MAQATIAPPTIKTLADLRKRLGGISLDRIWFHPAPGTATEKDVIEVENRENRLCELVDGALVEKAMGFDEARLALRLGRLIDTFVDQNDLGVCVGADGMMRIAGLVWLIDPKKRSARVFHAPDKSILVNAEQTLDGGDVLPGFVLRLTDLLDRGRRPRQC